MKFIQQKDMMDCGSACLAMIANHYGMPIIKQKEEHSTLQAAYGKVLPVNLYRPFNG
jgi:hypothetical protein